MMLFTRKIEEIKPLIKKVAKTAGVAILATESFTKKEAARATIMAKSRRVR